MDPGKDVEEHENGSSASLSDELLALPSTSVKLKKYTFNADGRLALLKSVREFDAHLAKHGEKDKAFEKVYSRFIENMPSSAFLTRQKPTVKTLRDKLRALLSARKSENRKNQAASGISEDMTQENMLLDDFVLELNESTAIKNEDKGRQTENEKKLKKAGEEIQQRALKRLSTTEKDGRSPAKKRKRSDDNEFEEWMEVMNEEMRDTKKLRREELDLRKKELELQEKKLQFEQEEKEGRRDTEKATLDLLLKLANKLQ